MKHLYQCLLRQRGTAVGYLLLGVTTAFLNNFCARYFQRVIDGFTDGALTAGILVLYGAALTALCLLNYLDNLPAGRLEHGIYLDLKVRALQKMRTLDYAVYRTLGTGQLVQRIENGAAAGKNMLFGFWFELARSLAPSVLFSMLFIWQLSPAVMLVILGGYAVVFLITHLLLRALYRIKERILTNEEQLNHTLVRGFMELVVFRLYKRFGREIRRAEEAGREIVDAKVKMTLIHEAFFTLFALLVIGIKLAILVYGWTSGALTIGQVVALLSLADYAYTPIAIFNVLYVQYKLDRTAFDRFTGFLDAPDDPQLDAGAPLEGLAGEIECRSLRFDYEGRPILSDFCLRIAPGERIALAGASGAGKSTLVGLLTGLLKPTAGQILVDGKDLRGVRLNSYYDRIAYVPQDAPIFDGTLRENLAFDRQEPDEALLHALEQAGLGPLYRTLSAGLETPLGERGVRLSGGERQRLALARLWFSEAGLILLDEATSALDAETERLVLTRLFKRLEGRTLLVIAHRLTALRSLDRFVVLRNGAVAAQGRWETLLDGSADFRRLVADGARAPGGREERP